MSLLNISLGRGEGCVEGTPFGRYRLIELLGRGGMGEVWRAHDTDTDRIVAIKVLPAHFSDDEDFQQRFRREAHAAARLNTPMSSRFTTTAKSTAACTSICG